MEFTPKFNRNVFEILLRDLARHENFNTRKLWEEEKQKLNDTKQTSNIINADTDTHTGKNKYGKKQKKSKLKISKKDKIILKIQETKQKKEIKKDLDFINNSLIIHKIDMNELKNKIGIMNTDTGRKHMKMAYLKEAFKRHDMLNTIDLFIEVGHLTFIDKKDQKILGKIKKKIDKKLGMSIELFQLYKLGERLPPLDFYNKHEFQLEKWQKRVLSHIERKNNIFLSAPTSAGKTVIVTNSILATEYRVIILLPTEELALQVTSSIHKFITKKDSRNYLLWTENYQYTNKNCSDNIYDSSYDILISTPIIIEQNLHKISNNYDYLIFDEIHCLNYVEIGPSIERIIHYFINCSFLALSATVANVEDLCEWWKQIRPNTDIHIEKYNNRFINLERHVIVNNSLTSLHPLGLITVEDLKNMNNNSLNELAFCPKDLAQCWMSINSVFSDSIYKQYIPELTSYSPETYFKQFNTYRITLRQTKLYETALKTLLVILAEKFEDKTRELLELFQINAKVSLDNEKSTMLQCAHSIRNSNLLPSLFFTSNYSETLNYYKNIIQQLEEQLDKEWPFFKEHQQIRKEQYDRFRVFKKKMNISREKEQNNSSSKNNINDNDNIKELIEEKYSKINQKEESKYINELIELYETTKLKLEKEIDDMEMEMEMEQNKTISNEQFLRKKLILKNLNEYYKNIYEWTTLPYISEFERPSPMCFYKISLTDNEIAEVQTILSNELTMQITTSNILLIGLFYGIGIYVKTLPVGYLRFLQKCAQNRKIGVMLSDRTLSMGISMPFLSVLLYQHDDDEFEQMEAVQMMGRCGRRNRDTTGHLILCNVDPKKLLLKKKTLITGSNIKTPLLGLLPSVRPSFSVLKITQCTIKDNILRKTETITDNNGNISSNTSITITTRPQIISNSENEDYYTCSRNSWINTDKNTNTDSLSQTTDFKYPVFSRQEKVIIWKSNTCFPYLNELYGKLSAYYFVGYLNNSDNRKFLNETYNNVLDKSLCYIISSCYFHTLLDDYYNDVSIKTVLKSFESYFENIKENKLIYNPLEQIICMTKNKRANILYEKLCQKMKNEKFQINDPLFVHYLYNIISFIKILAELPYLKDSPIYYSLYRTFTKIRKFLLGSSSGFF